MAVPRACYVTPQRCVDSWISGKSSEGAERGSVGVKTRMTVLSRWGDQGPRAREW
jgi:hypothetical protein